LNRNYGYYWNTGGSSALACSEVYHGGAAWNQLETVAARDAFLSIPRGSGQVYIAFHSYSQDFIYPWVILKILYQLELTFFKINKFLS
jgi:hypothetical protein